MGNTIFKRTTVDEARATLNSSIGQLIDVREYSEFATEHVAGATLVPLSDFDQNLSQIDRERPVYLMCRSGKRAVQAAERLANLGFKELRVIDGGMQAWAARGYPIERGTNRVWSLERQVRFAAGLIILGGVFLSLISPWFILIAGFIGAGLTFSAVTDTCGMGMMLARMPWNQKPKSLPSVACDRS
jgi:rhodanese-related sulfurtransferase